jgi:4-hydroxythreonine-4-phosphate dehydrogenase
MTVPRIAVTLGDPGGIGPEVVLKSVAADSSGYTSVIILFGAAGLIEEAGRTLNERVRPAPWRPEGTAEPGLYVRDLPAPGASLHLGRAGAENGQASFRFFEAAVDAAARGLVDAVVTGPISKAGWKLAGLPWRGHTEYLEHLYPGAVMSFWSERLRVALLSHHVPLADAVGRVRKDVLLDFLRRLDRGLAGLCGRPAEIHVAGLNPHAGEAGLLGTEEEEEIRPALAAASDEGIAASGPFPPDTVFLAALDKPNVVVAALYHDQGLIPFKLDAFASGVNATLGLPFVRTSPDHGTAFDIAGQGIADARSMTAAIALARRFVDRRG